MPEPEAIVYTDGGSRGNPGPSGIGVVIMTNGQQICTISKSLGITTNNVAEYTALVQALEKCHELGFQNIEVRMDSELIVRQIKGQYRVKNPGLIPLYQQARKLSLRFTSFSIVHVRRELNKDADRLANEAMDAAKIR